jgi:hypothetical protein
MTQFLSECRPRRGAPWAPAVQVSPGIVSPEGYPLPSPSSAGRYRWVESHSDLVCYRVLGMRSVKNGKLSEDIPARSFCRLAKHALHPVKQVRRVRPTGTARHGSLAHPVGVSCPPGKGLLPTWHGSLAYLARVSCLPGTGLLPTRHGSLTHLAGVICPPETGAAGKRTWITPAESAILRS